MEDYSKIIKVNNNKVYFDLPMELIEDNTHICAIASIKSFESIKDYVITEISCNAKCYLQENKIVCEVTGLYKSNNIDKDIKNSSLEVKVDILLLKKNEFDNKTFKPIAINELETLNK